MSYFFFKKTIAVDSKDNVCEKCGNIYKVHMDADTYDHGRSLECEKCTNVVVFSIHNIPDYQEMEKKYGVEKMMAIIEEQLPPCPDCGGRLIFSDLFGSGFPKKCPSCGHSNKGVPQKVANVSGSTLVKKEMTLLGYHQSEKTKP